MYNTGMKSSRKYDLVNLFQALADPTRLRLINLMGDDEVCVCFFVEILQTNQPKISRHLAYLRRAGIVAARREGKWIHYRMVMPSDPAAARILDEVRSSLKQDRELQRDRERLTRFCCAPTLPIHLQDAPRPSLQT